MNGYHAKKNLFVTLSRSDAHATHVILYDHKHQAKLKHQAEDQQLCGTENNSLVT